jgi:hypothetical protein
LKALSAYLKPLLKFYENKNDDGIRREIDTEFIKKIFDE